MLFCFTFIIPWRDCQFSVVYGFNYILPTALGIILLRLILNNDNVTHTSLFKIALCSFLFGWWHEGFSIPVIVGLCGIITLEAQTEQKIHRGSYLYVHRIGDNSDGTLSFIKIHQHYSSAR